MQPIAPALLAAQQSQSPIYSLSLTTRRGTMFSLTGGQEWQRINALPAGALTWNQAATTTTAIAWGTGVLRAFLSYADGRLALQNVTTPSSVAGNWNSAPLQPLESFSPSANATPRPCLLLAGGTLHLFYIKPDGNLYLRTSNDGATWTAPYAIYAGGDANGPLFAAYAPNSQLIATLFSRASRLCGTSRTIGGAWHLWPPHPDAIDWRPAGIQPANGTQFDCYAAANTATPAHEHRLARTQLSLAPNGSYLGWGAATAIYTVSGQGALQPAHYTLGSGFDTDLFALIDNAGGTYRHAAICAPLASGITQPLLIDGAPTSEAWLTPIQTPTATLVCGHSTVWRSQHEATTVTVTGDEIIAYHYETLPDQSGSITIAAVPNSALRTINPGDYLWLTRHCTQYQNSGSATLAFRVYAVEHHADHLTLIAYDAMGILGQTQPRRSLTLTPAAHATISSALSAFCAWAGIIIHDDIGIDEPTKPFQWPGGENGLSALYRLLQRSAAIIRSGNTPNELPALTVNTAATSSQYSYGNGAHPLITAATTEDARNETLVVTHGVQVVNDPAGREDWAIRVITTGGLSPNMAPNTRYTLNRSLTLSDCTDHAAATADSLSRQQSAGWLEAQANLALEIHDRITVNNIEYYVQRITEEWNRRQLTQKIHLSHLSYPSHAHV